MKTNYSPRYIKRDKLFTVLFYFIRSSASFHRIKWLRIKMLVLPALLLTQAATAQKLIAMRDNNGPASSNPASAFLNSGPKAQGDNNISSRIISDSASTAVSVIKEPASFIANNEDKAEAMVKSYFKGMDDADSNYQAKKSGKTLILVTTLIGGPIAGLIPAIVCSKTKPNNKNLNIPHSPLVTNYSYMKGYKNEAHYIKKHNTWPRYILASIVWVAAVNLIAH